MYSNSPKSHFFIPPLWSLPEILVINPIWKCNKMSPKQFNANEY